MKITFNDATEITIQSASIRVDGSLLIKTISATEEELRTMFQDEFKTRKMVRQNGSPQSQLMRITPISMLL